VLIQTNDKQLINKGPFIDVRLPTVNCFGHVRLSIMIGRQIAIEHNDWLADSPSGTSQGMELSCLLSGAIIGPEAGNPTAV
jgi:hypothetical protein